MGKRKALLIGVQEYGKGFDNLPAVEHDLALMKGALKARGFEPDQVEDGALGDPKRLADRILAFCEECQEGDVHIVYFTGHGISIGGEDFIVPARISREDAKDSQNHRVPTDFSTTVENRSTGLVLFLIDACRNPDHFAGSDWGRGKRKSPNPRFIRFLGCGSGQVCWVLEGGNGRQEVSVFTKALANVLLAGRETRLMEILEATKKACEDLAEQHPKLTDVQKPRLDLGEVEDAAVLKKTIFPRREVAAVSLAGGKWPEESFDPSRFHCLVVSSEQEAFYGDSGTLAETAELSLFGDHHERIWKSFRQYWEGRELVDGGSRELSVTFSDDRVRWAHRPLLYFLESGRRLEMAARALTEADLVVFDITGFEPGMMLLMGIRSAARRGVSISSHGGGWAEGSPLEIPFGLQDLNINCHTVATEADVGDNKAEKRLADRICLGFDQLARQPSYLDLPAYDALRQLGSQFAASGTIGLRPLKATQSAAGGERGSVLVLCSYTGDYSRRNWRQVKRSLTRALSREMEIRPRIERMIDRATPQLISQSIFELLRRVEACLVDWTEFKATVFLELGVRLAASPWGAVQIIDQRCLPGAEDALLRERWASGGDTDGRIGEKIGEEGELIQVRHLQEIFNPISYSAADPQLGLESVARLFRTRNPQFEEHGSVGERRDREQDEGPPTEAAVAELYTGIHRAVVDAVGRVSEALPEVYSALAESANALQHLRQEQVSAPQVLFHGNDSVKKDSERAALERRVAAWLYLEHRLRAGNREPGDPLLKLYAELGTSVSGGLLEGDPDLALSVSRNAAKAHAKRGEGREAVEGQFAMASFQKKLGDQRRKTKGKEREAVEAYEEAVRTYAEGLARFEDRAWNSIDLDTLPVSEPSSGQLAIATLWADGWGSKGGVHRRIADLRLDLRKAQYDRAVECYEEGAKLEWGFGLASTYNRVNFVKNSLLAGERAKRLEDLQDEIERVTEVLATRLREDAELSDDAWAWADYGDSLALKGDEEAAASAYLNFVDKAHSKAPESALDVLTSLVNELKETDPEASGKLARVRENIDRRMKEGRR